jgi:hypothetical protein
MLMALCAADIASHDIVYISRHVQVDLFFHSTPCKLQPRHFDRTHVNIWKTSKVSLGPFHGRAHNTCFPVPNYVSANMTKTAAVTQSDTMSTSTRQVEVGDATRATHALKSSLAAFITSIKHLLSRPRWLTILFLVCSNTPAGRRITPKPSRRDP